MRTALPPTMAVQAPHCERPLPNFGPRSRRSLLRTLQQRVRRIDVDAVSLTVDVESYCAHIPIHLLILIYPPSVPARTSAGAAEQQRHLERERSVSVRRRRPPDTGTAAMDPDPRAIRLGVPAVDRPALETERRIHRSAKRRNRLTFSTVVVIRRDPVHHCSPSPSIHIRMYGGKLRSTMPSCSHLSESVRRHGRRGPSP